MSENRCGPGAGAWSILAVHSIWRPHANRGYHNTCVCVCMCAGLFANKGRLDKDTAAEIDIIVAPIAEWPITSTRHLQVIHTYFLSVAALSLSLSRKICADVARRCSVRELLWCGEGTEGQFKVCLIKNVLSRLILACSPLWGECLAA